MSSKYDNDSQESIDHEFIQDLIKDDGKLVWKRRELTLYDAN